MSDVSKNGNIGKKSSEKKEIRYKLTFYFIIHSKRHQPSKP